MHDNHDTSDSDEETLGDPYDDEEDDVDADADMEDDPLRNMTETPGRDADNVTEDGDDESVTEESDDDEDDDADADEDDEDDEDEEAELDLDLKDLDENAAAQSDRDSSPDNMQEDRRTQTPKSSSGDPSPPPPPSASIRRSLSPAYRRKKALLFSTSKPPRSFTVEAICAIPHPVPTHALASSACMSHLLTGSDDGYIRDYDIYAAVNSKNFLTAPQRHHAGVVEGLMKSGQLRFWWENPSSQDPNARGYGYEDETGLAPVYSLAMQSDALWALAGSDGGYINLFTLRHDPGRLIHVMNCHHRTPISSLCLDYDEKGFFSAGWDGVAIQWDLNTGQNVRNFTAHNAQLTSIGLRPSVSSYFATSSTKEAGPGASAMDADTIPKEEYPEGPLFQFDDKPSKGANMDSDARSDVSFDPLFDDEPEDNMQAEAPIESVLAMPGKSHVQRPSAMTARQLASSTIPPPKGAPPLVNTSDYQNFSPDLLMTAFIDGQVILWDRRVAEQGRGVGRLWMNEKTPPWCLSACWSADGGQIYAGRRNGTVDVWDVRVLGQSGPANTPRLLKTLRNPSSSGVVSCVVPFPDGRHIASASVDNIRLWNVAECIGEGDGISKSKSGVQFKIIPGHHGGYVSQMLVDPGGKFLVSASSNRGLHGDSTRTVFVHDIKRVD